MNRQSSDWDFETSPAEEGKVDVTINGTSYGKFDADASGEPIQTQIGAFSVMQLTSDDGKTKGYIFTENAETGKPRKVSIGNVILDSEAGKILVSRVGKFSIIQESNKKDEPRALVLFSDSETGKPKAHSLGIIHTDDANGEMLVTNVGGFSLIQGTNAIGETFAYAIMDDSETGEPIVEIFGKVDADRETGKIFVTKVGEHDVIQETAGDGYASMFAVLTYPETGMPRLKSLGRAKVDETGRISLDTARLMDIVNRAVQDI